MKTMYTKIQKIDMSDALKRSESTRNYETLPPLLKAIYDIETEMINNQIRDTDVMIDIYQVYTTNPDKLIPLLDSLTKFYRGHLKMKAMTEDEIMEELRLTTLLYKTEM